MDTFRDYRSIAGEAGRRWRIKRLIHALVGLWFVLCWAVSLCRDRRAGRDVGDARWEAGR